MSNVISFPDGADRQWREWEVALRRGLAGVPVAVVDHALPRIRGHWEAVFEAFDLELPKRAVPGKLTRPQAEVIQSIIDDAAALVVRRLEHERRVAFERLIRVEIELSRHLLAIQQGAGTDA